MISRHPDFIGVLEIRIWWSGGGARFWVHIIKNADFCLYRTFLDPSISEILILFFEEDSEYIYTFLISRQKNSLKISRSGT